MKNEATEWVQRSGKTVQAARVEWDGACVEFAGDLQDALGRGRMAYFGGLLNPLWKYHCALEIDGIVHCLWWDEPKPLAEYMELIGADSVEYPSEEECAEQ